MPSYLDLLSKFVCETRLEDLQPSTLQAAKSVVLDTIGAMLAGSRLPENGKLAQLAAKTGGLGPATLLGQSGSAPAVFAALSNATAGVSLEMDEGNRLGGGHAAIHVVPAALAIACEAVLHLSVASCRGIVIAAAATIAEPKAACLLAA